MEEYYIVKPLTRHIFYLGKHFPHVDGINMWNYSSKPELPDYETPVEILEDLINNDIYGVYIKDNISVEDLYDFCYRVFEFCDAPVYIDNDCNDLNYDTWKNWEQKGGKNWI